MWVAISGLSGNPLFTLGLPNFYIVVELSPYNVLILIAFGLMVTVSGGVLYLTLAEWRDRRRQNEDKRATKATKPTKRRR